MRRRSLPHLVDRDDDEEFIQNDRRRYRRIPPVRLATALDHVDFRTLAGKKGTASKNTAYGFAYLVFHWR
jgi:hypothetical protein